MWRRLRSWPMVRDARPAAALLTMRSWLFQQIPESPPRLPRLLRRRRIHLGKPVAPVPGAAGVDDGAAVGEVAGRLALGLDARIERGRPRVVDDVDRGRRI